MPVVEYGKDDDELLEQPMKKYQHETSDETDGYSIIVTVPSNAFIFLQWLVKINLWKYFSLSIINRVVT